MKFVMNEYFQFGFEFCISFFIISTVKKISRTSGFDLYLNFKVSFHTLQREILFLKIYRNMKSLISRRDGRGFKFC